eukprot:TRINITY_DN9385_c0_g1_i1.p1 TRINITY_DN9385_c0_g1~~TRINITY_DN9385_c0_g1_i1.p1  ORF type:complete len:608 (-),score=169.07 TRINITY_DN9385_c0_g1_i1:558-2381(-)
MEPQAPPPREASATPRPQSHRYLRETLGKLAEDAERILERGDRSSPRFASELGSDTGSALASRPETPLLGSLKAMPGLSDRPLPGIQSFAPSPEPEPSIGTLGVPSKPPLPVPPGVSARVPADVEVWRNAFLAEAADSVRAMKDVVSCVTTNSFASRFEEWRKADLKATAQAQQHVKELARLNDAIERFLLNSATPEEFGSFHAAMVKLRDIAGDLSTARREITEGVDTIALRSSTLAVKEWEADVRSSSGILRDHSVAQMRHYDEEKLRYSRLEERIGDLQTSMQQVCKEVQQFGSKLEELTEANRSAKTDAEDVMEKAVNAAAQEATNACEDFAEQVSKLCSQDNEATRRHVSHLLVGLTPEAPLSDFLQLIDERIQDVEANSRRETKKYQDIGEQLQRNVNESSVTIAKLKHEIDQNRKLLSEQSDLSVKLKKELDQVKHSLDEAQALKITSAMKCIMDIERTGRLKLNRQTGDIKLLQPIDFMVRKPNEEPTAEFKNLEGASEVLGDVAKLVKYFASSPPPLLQVDCVLPKNAKMDFWQKIAENRASLLRSWLKEHGLGARDLQVNYKVTEGKGAGGVSLHLDREFFPGEVVKRKAGQSPGRA